MKLAVVTDWGDKKSAFFWNKDGILKMLQVLRDRDGWDIIFFRKHERTFYWDHDYVTAHLSPDPGQAVRDWNPDAILFFCDFSREILKEFRDSKIPKAQCYTGGLYEKYKDVPDIIFVESKSYLDWMKAMGLNVVQAFGTNTELFHPMSQPKFYDALFPATFASWKRHWLFAEAMGPKGLVCGWHQEREPDVLQSCQRFGVGILHHQMPESLVYLYNQTRTVVITSNTHGGSQRTALEAMACNIPLIVMNDSDKMCEYIQAAGEGAMIEPDVPHIREAVEEWKNRKVNTRPWVVANYSEGIYATKVRDGILSIL